MISLFPSLERRENRKERVGDLFSMNRVCSLNIPTAEREKEKYKYRLLSLSIFGGFSLLPENNAQDIREMCPELTKTNDVATRRKLSPRNFAAHSRKTRARNRSSGQEKEASSSLFSAGIFPFPDPLKPSQSVLFSKSIIQRPEFVFMQNVHFCSCSFSITEAFLLRVRMLLR